LLLKTIKNCFWSCFFFLLIITLGLTASNEIMGLIIRWATFTRSVSNHVSYDSALVEDMINPEIIDSNGIIKCPVNRDISISSVGREKIGNSGKSTQLKLKSIQEYILCDVDVSNLKGLLIKNARLHFRSASPFKAPVIAMGVSTLGTDWVEGQSRTFKPEKGASCFVQAQYGQKNWAYDGSTLMDVVFGRGYTIWDSTECSPPDNEGWQQVTFDPDIVAARIAGISKGFCLYDDVGSEWYEVSGKFRYDVLPNRLIYSRESFKSTPWLELEISGRDFEPPDAVDSIRVETKGLPAGEAFLFWPTPSDTGGGKTLGFEISWKRGCDNVIVGSENQRLREKTIVKKGQYDRYDQNDFQPDEAPLRFPGYLVPMAGKPGEEVKMHIHDINFIKYHAGGGHFREPCETVEVSLVSVDTSGNRSKPFVKQIFLSSGWRDINILQADIIPFHSTQKGSDEKSSIAIIDLLDKYIPETKQIIPKHEDGYKQENHIFSNSQKKIRLHGARNEDVWFQIVIETDSPNDISFQSLFEGEPGIKPVFYRFEHVKVKEEHGKELLIPDPLVPAEVKIAPGKMVPVKTGNQNRRTLVNGISAYVCEIFIPHEITPGLKKGSLIVKQGDTSTKFDINLMVWNFTLPDKLSFVPEMNAYSSRVSPYKGYQFYRLAHRHRTCMNLLPYGWNGLPEFAPKITEKGFLWNDWDKYVGPLIDGSAFHDLPRKNQPVDVMYLPLSENWPVPLQGNYKKSWWADEALSDTYRQQLKQAFADFVEHIMGIGGNTTQYLHQPYTKRQIQPQNHPQKETRNKFKAGSRNLTQTKFQFYLDNKVYYRERFKQSSAPWIFDEPIHIQDFMALKWYGKVWHEAVDLKDTDSRLCFRADISYTQFGRDILWGVTDIEYLGGNNAQKTRMKQDEFNQGSNSRFAEYGTVNRILDSNLQPVLWQLSAWSRGASGVLPWQTIGSDNCWEAGEQTALFYPIGEEVFPSVRLKAFQSGQQFVEYLVLLAKVLEVPEAAVGKWLKNRIKLDGIVNKTYADDAGTVVFKDVTLTDLWRIRYEIGQCLSEYAEI